jgi:hypothetical protein
MTTTRPELGTLAPGDKVYVTPPRYGLIEPEPIEATVKSVARVWVTIVGTVGERKHPQEWRMRLDTQDEGDRNYSQRNARFETPDQHAYDRRLTAAYNYLLGQGIRLDWDSPWRDRTVELADLLRTADQT